MRVRVLVGLLALAACDEPRRDGLAVDAAVDAAELVDAEVDTSRMPFTTTGTTPLGSLDDIRFISVSYFNGFCPSGYTISLYRTNNPYDVAVVHFDVRIAEDMEPPTGTIPARAYLSGGSPGTDEVTFEVVHVDVPPVDPLRIAGRMRASTGAWNIDFSLDAQTMALVCI